MRSRTRVLVSMGAAAAIALGSGLPAAADPTSMTATPNPVVAGEDVTVSGEGCGVGEDEQGNPIVDPNATVFIDVALVEDLDGGPIDPYLEGTSVAVGTASPHDGSWSAPLTIPADATPSDSYVVTSRCEVPIVELVEGGASQAITGRAAPNSFDYEPVLLEILPPAAIPIATTPPGRLQTATPTTPSGRTPTAGGTPAASSRSGQPLPATGAETLWLLGLGLGLGASGAAASVVSRRLRPTEG